jgi:hypothetical protein
MGREKVQKDTREVLLRLSYPVCPDAETGTGAAILAKPPNPKQDGRPAEPPRNGTSANPGLFLFQHLTTERPVSSIAVSRTHPLAGVYRLIGIRAVL